MRRRLPGHVVCALCHGPLVRRTMQFDAAYRLVCAECYLAQASADEIAMALAAIAMEPAPLTPASRADRICDKLFGMIGSRITIGHLVGAALGTLIGLASVWVALR